MCIEEEEIIDKQGWGMEETNTETQKKGKKGTQKRIKRKHESVVLIEQAESMGDKMHDERV